MKFAVIGGDRRIERLCRLISADGHEISAFALEKAETLKSFERGVSIKDATSDAGCVVLPLPASVRTGWLSTPLSAGEYTMEEVFGALPKNALVCGGRLSADVYLLAGRYGARLWDYFDREELQISNAVATAEGAIQLIMQNTAKTLWGSSCLVVGFGRIGKLLAHRLRGLGARVAVSARSYGDRAWIEAYGYVALRADSLSGRLADFDVVVNTVPAPVLGEERLREIKADALVMDLASKPGGVDFAAASRLGVHVTWALSLPGEVAPETSGAIIRDSIYNILKENGNEKI